jgi:hypothetical protein
VDPSHLPDLNHTLSLSKDLVRTSVVVLSSVQTVSSLLLTARATVSPLLVVLMTSIKMNQPNKRNQLELGSIIQTTTTELKPTISVSSNSVHHSTCLLPVSHQLLCQETRTANGCQVVQVSESVDGATPNTQDHLTQANFIASTLTLSQTPIVMPVTHTMVPS